MTVYVEDREIQKTVLYHEANMCVCAVWSISVNGCRAHSWFVRGHEIRRNEEKEEKREETR
jgi:hypothetical protein